MGTYFFNDVVASSVDNLKVYLPNVGPFVDIDVSRFPKQRISYSKFQKKVFGKLIRFAKCYVRNEFKQLIEKVN